MLELYKNGQIKLSMLKCLILKRLLTNYIKNGMIDSKQFLTKALFMCNLKHTVLQSYSQILWCVVRRAYLGVMLSCLTLLTHKYTPSHFLPYIS